MSYFKDYLLEALTTDSVEFDLTKSKYKSMYDKSPKRLDSFDDGDLVRIYPQGRTWKVEIENYEDFQQFDKLPTIGKAVDKAVKFCEDKAKQAGIKIRLFGWVKEDKYFEFAVKYID